MNHNQSSWSKSLVRVALAMASLLLGTGPVLAETFNFSYSGRLTEANGRPVAGPVELQVSFYRAATGGSPVLSVTDGLTAVPLQEGIFQISLQLAGDDFHDAFPKATEAVYVEITDLTNRPDDPYERQLVAMVPYAAKVPVDDERITFDGQGRATLKIAGTDGAGKVIASDGSGGLTWAAAPAATVTDVGGVTAANVATGANAANQAASTATADTIVKRDGAGGFAATAVTTISVTAGSVALTAAASTDEPLSVTAASGQTANLTEWLSSTNALLAGIGADGSLKLGSGAYSMSLKAPAGMAGDVTYVLPDSPTNGSYLKTDGAGNLSWDTPSGSDAAWLGAAPATFTTLTAPLSAGATSATVTSTAGYPASGTLRIDNELIRYGSITATTFGDLTRGTFDTTDAAHTAAASVVNFLLIGARAGNVNPALVVSGDGKVGIGTTNPVTDLHVKAAGDVKFNLQSGNENKDVHLMFSTGFVGGNTHKTAIVADGSSYSRADLHFVLNSVNNNAVNYSAGTDTKMIIKNEGDVGIGTTTPGAKLEVAGKVKITGGTPGAGKVLTSDADGLATWETPSAGNFAAPGAIGATTPSTGAFTTLTGNNLGIGASSPATDIAFGGTLAREIAVERNSGAGTTGANLTVGAGGANAGVADLDGGDLVLSSGTATGNGNSSIEFKTAGGGGTGSSDSAPSTKMTILGNGNVGIGTASPGENLTVAGSARVARLGVGVDPSSAPNGVIYASAVATNSLYGLGPGGSLTFNSAYLKLKAPGIAGVDLAGPDLLLEAGPGTGQGDGGSIIFSVAPAAGASSSTSNSIVERMRLTSEGNVGIGTTSPTHSLHVAPTSGATAGQTMFIQDATPTTGVTGVVIMGGAAQSNNNIFEIQKTDGAKIFGVQQFGNPYLEVPRIQSISGGLSILGRRGSGTGPSVQVSDNAARSSTSGTLSILETAGAFNPASGTAAFSAVGISSSIDQSSGATGVTRGLYVNPTLTSAADFRAIETVTGNVILGSTSGSVGIGTTTPQSALQVAGYTQLDLTTGVPPAGDCDAAAEYGRMKVDATDTTKKLWICTAAGWLSATLN